MKIKNKGLTLIEMLIVFSIFSIVLTAVIGIFVSAIRGQRFSLSSQQLVAQTSYALEYVGRSMRTAQKGTPSCANEKNFKITGGNRIEFLNANGECQVFYVENFQLKEDKDGVVNPLTSDDFKVNSLNIILDGDSPGDKEQPRVTLLLDIEGKLSGPNPRLKIQTTITKRNLDN